MIEGRARAGSACAARLGGPLQGCRGRTAEAERGRRAAYNYPYIRGRSGRGRLRMAFAELTDVRCYYEVLGEGDPLLLVAGLGTTCRVWDAVAPDLARHFSVILVDNRNVGRSAGRRTPKTVADLAADLVELLDELQVDAAHVLGVSLGGIIAQRLAIDHPGRVSRLVLVSTAARFTPYLRAVSMLLGRSL